MTTRSTKMPSKLEAELCLGLFLVIVSLVVFSMTKEEQRTTADQPIVSQVVDTVVETGESIFTESKHVFIEGAFTLHKSFILKQWADADADAHSSLLRERHYDWNHKVYSRKLKKLFSQRHEYRESIGKL